MLRTVLVHGVLLAALMAGPAYAQAAAEDQRSQQIESFRDEVAALHTSGLDSGGLEFARRVSRHYETLRAHYRPMSSLTDPEELLDLFKATTTAIFYTNDAAYLPDIVAAFDLLERRGQATEKVRSDMRSSLVRVRAFDEMAGQGLASETDAPALKHAPGLNQDLPLVIRADRSGRPVVENYQWQKGLSVIVVYGPHCAPSKKALTAISADRELAGFFRKRAIWLMPVDDDLHVAAMMQLAKNPASSNVAVAYNRSSWPQIESWTTPMFYFFRDGKLTEVQKGWPSDTQLETIRRGVLSGGSDNGSVR
ncbi:hypothetical protein LJR168_000082 [Pseudoxanthomonas sp. LjRoot168]|uniref:hypothetical protein n=1 Tax=unclassified Pseudoxanthomonas TaxID=2645906 RepID=UPI003ECFA0F1